MSRQEPSDDGGAGETQVWTPGSAPVAVVMISFNEAHHMEAVLANLKGWAQEVFLVDSYSTDETVRIALEHGVHVVQRPFRGFGDQWNYAIRELPITAPWTMKIDPDERLTDPLKRNIETAIAADDCDGMRVDIRLWFIGKMLPARLNLLRLWRSGTCEFSAVSVNEHALVPGRIIEAEGEIEHHDSPNLHHWFDKQNRYTTAEAAAAVRGAALSTRPKFFGGPLERRMWLKAVYPKVPGRHLLMFLYCYFYTGAYKCGRVGLMWARLRVTYFRMIDAKRAEMEIMGAAYDPPRQIRGAPHPDARQVD